MSDGEDAQARWQQVDQCFDHILDTPPEKRDSALLKARAQYGDSVVDEVVALLAALESSPDVLSTPAGEQWDAISPISAGRVGRWVIIERLGAGGQGDVFLARKQAERFEQKGALKMVRNRFSAGAMERFLRERQTLAKLRHPNIATLLDAGASEDGHPYLVSEYLPGEALHHYVDCVRPTLPALVRLLLPLVDAVVYAHGQFVLHRDIKPANVIVDDQGAPYLLDFGVFAAIAEGTPVADAGTPYTPSYAAPEQIRGEAVDVRADVWGLGAMFYRLLAGRPAFSGKDAEATSQAVLAGQPSDPCRDAELNAIVAKCLRQSQGERYQEVAELRSDLQAWLHNAPVVAFRGRAWYGLGKWLQRHRLLAATGLAAVFALLIGAGVATYQAQLATDERDRANAAAQRYQSAVGLLVEVFNGANPAQHRGETPTADDLLEAAFERVTGMQQQPGVQALLKHELAAVFLNRGEAERAASLARAAVAYFESRQLTADETYANLLVSLGSAEKLLGQYRAAIAALEQSLQVQREHLWPESDWRFAYTQNLLGSIYTLQGDYAQAAEVLRAARASLMTSPEAPAWLLGLVTRNYWDTRFRQGELNEARQGLQGWLAEHRGQAAEEPRAFAHASLGEIALLGGRYEDGVAAFADASRLIESVYGAENRHAQRFAQRRSYAQVLARLNGSARLKRQAFVEPDAQPASLDLAQQLSLLPYVSVADRARVLDVIDGADAVGNDPLQRHQNHLLRALAYLSAARQTPATVAMEQAQAMSLPPGQQRQRQQRVQRQLAAVLKTGSLAACADLQAALQASAVVEFVVFARGIDCANLTSSAGG